MKQFKTVNGRTTKLQISDGSSALVGPDFVFLQEKFHAAAYAAGCISDDMILNTSAAPAIIEKLEKISSREDEIRTAIAKAMATMEDKAKQTNKVIDWSVTKPTLTIVNMYLDYKIFSTERDAVFAKYFTTQDQQHPKLMTLQAKLAKRKQERKQ